MAERVDVSRLSVAECMALGGGAGEPAKEEGLQGKLEKLVQEIGLEVDGVDRHLHTGLEDPERTQPTDPRGVLEEALNKTADITAVQLKIGILERLETGLGQIELTEEQRTEWREFLTQIIDGGAPDRTPEETVSQIAGELEVSIQTNLEWERDERRTKWEELHDLATAAAQDYRTGAAKLPARRRGTPFDEAAEQAKVREVFARIEECLRTLQECRQIQIALQTQQTKTQHSVEFKVMKGASGAAAGSDSSRERNG